MSVVAASASICKPFPCTLPQLQTCSALMSRQFSSAAAHLTVFSTPALQPNFNATVTGANSVTFPRPGTSDPVLAAGDSYWFRCAYEVLDYFKTPQPAVSLLVITFAAAAGAVQWLCTAKRWCCRQDSHTHPGSLLQGGRRQRRRQAGPLEYL